eukprot:SAG31_NODE_18301_length_641_cov_0.756458_1_plen_140_part_00
MWAYAAVEPRESPGTHGTVLAAVATRFACCALFLPRLADDAVIFAITNSANIFARVAAINASAVERAVVGCVRVALPTFILIAWPMNYPSAIGAGAVVTAADRAEVVHQHVGVCGNLLAFAIIHHFLYLRALDANATKK